MLSSDAVVSAPLTATDGIGALQVNSGHQNGSVLVFAVRVAREVMVVGYRPNRTSDLGNFKIKRQMYGRAGFDLLRRRVLDDTG